MNEHWHMLAQDGYGPLIVTAIFMIIAVISGLIQKAAQKQREREQAERQQQQRAAQKRQPAPTGQPPPVPSEPAPPRPESAVAAIRRAMQEAMGVDPDALAHRQKVQQARQRQAALAASRKQAELAAQKERQRRAAAAAQQASRAALAAPYEQQAGVSPVPSVHLDSRAKLRQAIIHMEILGPPKALRNQPESWDV